MEHTLLIRKNMSDEKNINLDVAIIGGGVAALWTANALKNAGFGGRFGLFTNAPLGSGQSLAAQGVIHGGLKYALGGKLNESSEALASMPGRWADCLAGKGEIDLTGVQVLNDHQLLWSLPGVLSQVVSFFGSKALSGRAESVKREDFPPVFDTPEYRGKIFKIEERVLDPQSIIAELAKPVAESCFQIHWDKADFVLENGKPVGIRLESGETIFAKKFVFAAGKGNGELLAACGFERPQMQLRPLHQVVIKKAGLPDFFSVCIGNTPKPPIVSTTHTDSEGCTVWYIGGDLAEADGVVRDEVDQISTAQRWFAKHMPWIDLAGAEWSTMRVDRAEPKTESGARPPGAYCEKVGENVMVAWPTKLALAPDLADGVMAGLGLEPSDERGERIPLQFASIGKPVWF